MSFIMNNWETIASVIVLIAVVAIYVVPKVVEFIGYPTAKKMEVIKKYLLTWVTEAETKFDDGDFDLILNYVYTAFISKFQFVAKWITEEKFEVLVRDAIDELKGVLSKNGKTLATLHNPNVK
jgi:hypothetical protein